MTVGPSSLLYELAQLRKIPFFKDISTRFEGLAEEHLTFVLERSVRQPSGVQALPRPAMTD